MRIVHIMPWYVPSMSYQENYLPAEQKKLGHKVDIVTCDRIPSYQGYDGYLGRMTGERILGTGTFEDNGIAIHRLKTIFEIQNGGMMVSIGMKRKLEELSPNVVQAHGAFVPSTLQAIAYSKRLGYRAFVDDHTHEENFHLDSLGKRAYISTIKSIYRICGDRVSQWMPITYSSREILHSVLEIPFEKMQLLPLGADATRFKKSEELRKQGRKEIAIDLDDFLIISSGKFHESKDIIPLIEAFSDVIQIKPSCKLLLVGNGPADYMERLRIIAKKEGIENSVIFHDYVGNEELPRYYNAADVGVWPGNPSITVIEAIAAGLPVIVPENDLAYKILFDNHATMGFKRGDKASLSAAMLSLMENESNRSALSINAMQLVANELSWEKIAEKSIHIYSEGMA